jgi:hypothetical protein
LILPATEFTLMTFTHRRPPKLLTHGNMFELCTTELQFLGSYLAYLAIEEL